MARHTDRDKRPTAIAPDFACVPDELMQVKQWVLWRFDWNDQRGEWAKVPYQTSGRRASSVDPETWATYAIVMHAFETKRASFDGIGFVFSADSPYVGVDLDMCVTHDTENAEYHLTAFAARIIERLQTYTEMSPSQTGVHLIGKAGELAALKTDWNGNAVEVYRTGRYFTFTGVSWHENALLVADIHGELTAIADKIRESKQANGAKTTQPAMTVDRRLELALKNKKLALIFNGDISEYAGDDSRADLALCRLLAYYSDGSGEILDSLFRKSKLFRGKWDDKRGDKTYGEMTIEKVLTSQKNYLTTRTSQPKTESTYDTRRVRRYGFDDLWSAAMEYRSSGAGEGMNPGWYDLNELYRPRKGLLSIVVGDPGSGKSTFVDCMAYNIARRYGIVMTFASFETQPIQRHILDLCQIHLRKPTFSFIEGAATDDEMERAREEIGEYFKFITPDDDEMQLETILEYVDDDIKDYGIGGFILDPWSDLDQTRDLRQAQTEFISTGLRRLRSFTRHRDAHTWLIVHPTKTTEHRVDGRPTLYSPSGSAHFYNVADYGLVIHRWNDDQTTVYVDKVKFSEVGKKGEVTYRYFIDERRYVPVASEYEVA
jgi:energy-coupling factor transporter ATP-binding protein EcfA2